MLRNTKGQFKKGCTPWNKGVTKSEDYRLSGWTKGIPRSEETKRKISDTLRRHDITPEIIWQEYWIKQKTQKEIAKELGCSRDTIIERMNEWGIPTRPRGQITRMVNQKRMAHRSRQVKWNPELQNYLDGLLLGDGYINKYENYYNQSFALRYRGWAEQIQEYFSFYGIKSKISKTYIDRRGLSRVYLRTSVYNQFGKERNRWYSNGEKVIPRDLDLSSRHLLLNWYLGDGSLKRLQNRRSFAVFYIRRPEQDVREWLSKRLNELLGIVSTPYSREINLHADGTRIFMDYIKDLQIPDCFQYKFDL